MRETELSPGASCIFTLWRFVEDNKFKGKKNEKVLWSKNYDKIVWVESPTLDGNRGVEQYISEGTHTPNVLRF